MVERFKALEDNFYIDVEELIWSLVMFLRSRDLNEIGEELFWWFVIEFDQKSNVAESKELEKLWGKETNCHM